MYPVLKFCGEFTSPFHTSQYNYSNLYTCAPYILGSSLRGVILRALIDTHCKQLEKLRYDNPGYHDHCPEKCEIKPLFRLPTRFSFGEFKNAEEGVVVHNRVGIDRQTFSQAEGNLLSVEERTGAFTFRVLLPDANLIKTIKEGVQEAAQRRYGLGRFQSLGWGQFSVLSVQPGTKRIAQPDVDGRSFRFRFKTPYVLEETVQTPKEWGQRIEKQLKDALQLPENDTSVAVKRVIPRWRSLSYVRRWSDESHKKLNRLVAEPGSELEVHFATPPSSEQMALWQWGIGEWLECGFGSFQFEVVN